MENSWQVLKLWDAPIEAKYLDEGDEDFTKDKPYSIMAVVKDDDDYFCFLVLNDKGRFCEVGVGSFTVTKTKHQLFEMFDKQQSLEKVE